MNYWYILILASLVACVGALLGSLIMLKRMTLVADAISHSVLPGIVISYIFINDMSSWTMLISATFTGLFTVFLIEILHHKIKLQEDASIGIIFTFLFSIGVILVSKYTGHVDLDLDCVLYGELAYVGLGNPSIPNEIVVMTLLLIVVLGFIIGGYRYLQLITFDSSFASSLGVSVMVWQYLLMGLVSLTTVVSFESVGSILIIAFIVVPSATAFLISKQLHKLLLLSCAFGLSAVGFGFLFAWHFDSALSASMSSVAGIQFFVVLGIQKFNTQFKTLNLEQV